jgi:hypothetical protein
MAVECWQETSSRKHGTFMFFRFRAI